MKTWILAALAAFSLGIGATQMAHADQPWYQKHVQADNGRG
jgi:hypothetical protein